MELSAFKLHLLVSLRLHTDKGWCRFLIGSSLKLAETNDIDAQMSENKTNTRCLNPVNKINPALTHIPEAIVSLASKTFGISKLVRVTM